MKIITRRGVIVDTVPEENKCKSREHSTFHYELKVCFPNDVKLDEDGFIVDHNYMHREIISINVRSCELLAQDIIDTIVSFCKQNGLSPVAIKLSIFPVLPIPNEGAYFTQIWAENSGYSLLAMSL